MGSGKYAGDRSASASAECPGAARGREGAAGRFVCASKMEQHRKNPVCASCHKIMDPIGFSLENFDLIGKWRAMDGGKAIDATSQLVDGTQLNGPASLRQALLSRSDVFVRTMTEKLLTYGTGRGLKYYDMPAVRSIARDAARNNNRFSSIILGIVKSDPFQMKVKQAEAQAQSELRPKGSGRRNHGIHYQEVPFPPHHPARHGRVDGACRCSIPWSRRKRRWRKPRPPPRAA